MCFTYKVANMKKWHEFAVQEQLYTFPVGNTYFSLNSLKELTLAKFYESLM